MTGVLAAPAGVVEGMPGEVYHADLALSSSGAKLLLPPSCPAVYRWRRDNPEPHKSAYDLGHAAHLQVLGIGPKVKVVDAGDWRTKAAKEARAEAYAAGEVPLLAEQWADVRAMAEELARHPMAAALLNPDHGRPELSLFWNDRPTGVAKRARLDWLHQRAGGRTVAVDYKTTTSAHPDALSKTVNSFGYHTQGAWYLDGVQALDLGDPDTLFVLIFQEKQPPYLVNCVQLDPHALRTGRDLAGWATQIFADCTAADSWPGYGTDIDYVSLPPWAEHREGTL